MFNLFNTKDKAKKLFKVDLKFKDNSIIEDLRFSFYSKGECVYYIQQSFGCDLKAIYFYEYE